MPTNSGPEVLKEGATNGRPGDRFIEPSVDTTIDTTIEPFGNASIDASVRQGNARKKVPTEVAIDIVSLASDGLGEGLHGERRISVRNALPGEQVHTNSQATSRQAIWGWRQGG